MEVNLGACKLQDWIMFECNAERLINSLDQAFTNLLLPSPCKFGQKRLATRINPDPNLWGEGLGVRGNRLR